MPRRGKIKKQPLPPDVLYNSTLVSKFITSYMKEGKRSVAEKTIYGVMDLIKEKAKEDPLKTLEKAVENVRPLLETKSRRVGGATYQVPVEVPMGRSVAVGVRWLLHYAYERGGKSMKDKLFAEIMDAVANRGGAVKKREDTHKMAAHYRW